MRSLSFSLVFLALTFAFAASPATADDESNLSNRQAGVAERYQRLEELLLRLADVESTENPERSALLRRAARQSRDKFVLEKLRGASESLRTEEFQRAVDNQQVAGQELGAMLKLLLSEDRSKRIRDEKERVTKLIKDLKRNLNNQRSARARTENGADIDDVQDEQKAVTKRSEELRKRLAEENQPGEDSQDGGEAESGEKQQESEGKGKDGENKESEKQEDSKQDDKENSKQGKDGKEKDKNDEKENDKDASKSDESSKQSDSSQQSPEKQDSSQQSESQQGKSQQSKSQDSQKSESKSQQKQSQQQQDSQQQDSQQQQQKSAADTRARGGAAVGAGDREDAGGRKGTRRGEA